MSRPLQVCTESETVVSSCTSVASDVREEGRQENKHKAVPIKKKNTCFFMLLLI